MKIAVLIGGIIYDSQKELINGINDMAKQKNAKIFVFTCGGDIYSANDHSRGEFQIYNLPDLSSFEGIIVAPNTIQNAEVVKTLEQRLSKLSVPVIVIDGKMGDLCRFGVDNEKAIFEMTEHVIKEHGKRKILYLSGPAENVESIQRLSGFLKCAEMHQLSERKDFRIMYGDFWIDSGRNIMRECLQKYGLPEAVICANDYMAIGALEEMKKEGYRIPQDVIVTGFDDSIDGRFHIPRITTIAKPLYKIGKEACRCLLENNIKKKVYHFPVEKIFSESCGCNNTFELSMHGFKTRMIKEKTNNIRWAEVLNSMSADLNELNTFEEFISKLKAYIRRLDFPYFYLCLCEDKQLMGELKLVEDTYRIIDSEVTDYTEKIEVVIAYENGNFHEHEIIEKENLLPKRFFEQEKSIFSVVVPIHFRLHCMGYCVVGDSAFPLETIQFQSWIMNLGNGLENIRKQMMMQNMINQLNKMWIYDTMTGVLNRAGFYSKAGEFIRKCREQNKEILLLFVDADKLKTVNDTYGHEEGDFYIKCIAKACQKCINKNGIVMRYGGDEFVVLKEYAQEDVYSSYVLTIKNHLCQITNEENKSYVMDASVGYYISKIEQGFKLETIVEQADKDMYIMKKNKRTKEQGDKNGK